MDPPCAYILDFIFALLYIDVFATFKIILCAISGGYKIPKGTSVMINHLALHYNPTDWAEPNKFKPGKHQQHQALPALSHGRSSISLSFASTYFNRKPVYDYSISTNHCHWLVNLDKELDPFLKL